MSIYYGIKCEYAGLRRVFRAGKLADGLNSGLERNERGPADAPHGEIV